MKKAEDFLHQEENLLLFKFNQCVFFFIFMILRITGLMTILRPNSNRKLAIAKAQNTAIPLTFSIRISAIASAKSKKNIAEPSIKIPVLVIGHTIAAAKKAFDSDFFEREKRRGRNVYIISCSNGEFGRNYIF